MKWGLKGGISIYADSGPPRYVLWCCCCICHEVLTFFQIGCGHTVRASVACKNQSFRSWLLCKNLNNSILAPKIMEGWNNQLYFFCKLLRLCHLSTSDIKKNFCNLWFSFCKNEAFVNCGTINATTLIWLLSGL